MSGKFQSFAPQACFGPGAALLALLVAVLYGQTLGYPFLITDDQQFVAGNAFVLGGFTAPGIALAFSEAHASNWIPLTWLSFMLDVELFGRGPFGFHLTNVVLHALCAVLLFAFLIRATGRTGPAFFAAALLAVHPIHVESVAWIPERKDVLSLALGLGSLIAYTAYGQRGGAARYALAALLLAAGLLAKPLLVTLPFVYLLLDLWPLGRWRISGDPPLSGLGAREAPSVRSLGALALEKAPFLAIVAGAIAATLLAQSAAISVASDVPLLERVNNALVSGARYLGKAIWPGELALFYVHPDLPGGRPWTAWQVAASGGLLVALTAVAGALRRARFVLVGWLWFLGTLVPMLGLVQVGTQAMADRYAYLPFIGLYIAAVWSVDALAGAAGSARARREAARRGAALLGVAALAALGVRTWLQVPVWGSSRALYENALAASPRSPEVLSGLGLVAYGEGRTDDAIALFQRALEVDPDYALAHSHLGVAFAAGRDMDRAVKSFYRSLAIDPRHAITHVNLGIVLQAHGGQGPAVGHFAEALHLEPDYAEAHALLARALPEGDPRAERHLNRAIDLRQERLVFEPDSASARMELATLLAEAGRRGEALAQAEQALRLAPGDAAAEDLMARLLVSGPGASPEDAERAIALARQATSRDDAPDPRRLATLADAYASAGRIDEAIETARSALDGAEARGLDPVARWLRGRIARYRALRAGESAPIPEAPAPPRHPIE